MSKQIVFVINSIRNPRCIKRVNEFVDAGFRVKVYAFDRGGEMYNAQTDYAIHFVKGFSNNVSYLKRLPVIYHGVRRIVAENKGSHDAFYLFGLDIAMLFVMVCPKEPFIYEESDLTHTYLPNRFLRRTFDWIDRYVIRRSLQTVFTSDGFRQYHFGDKFPENCHVIPNRLSVSVKGYIIPPKDNHDNLRIGFVGHIRFRSVKSFVDTFCRNYPQNEFHFFGDFVSQRDEDSFDSLKQYENCHFHGTFQTPRDLPVIYSKIDLVLATYDVSFDNVRYAEPNKLYEAIYFETPIIVSEGCFLGDKVTELNVGYAVDALCAEQVKALVSSLTQESIDGKIERMRTLGKDFAVNYNGDFFAKLNDILV